MVAGSGRLRLEPLRFFQAGHRFVDLAGFEEAPAEHVLHVPVPGGQALGALGQLHGLLEVATLLGVDAGEIRQGADGLGIGDERPRVRGQRLVDSLVGEIEITRPPVRLREHGREPARLQVALECPRAVVTHEIAVAEIQVGRAELGIEPEGVVELTGRPRWIATPSVERSQRVVERGIPGPLLDQRIGLGDGFGNPPRLDIRHEQGLADSGALGRKLEGCLTLRDGVVRPVGSEVTAGQQQVRRNVGGLEPDGRAKLFLRAGGIVATFVDEREEGVRGRVPGIDQLGLPGIAFGQPEILSRQRDVAEPDHGIQVLGVALQDLSEFSFGLRDLTIPEQVLTLQEKRAVRFRAAGGRGPALGQGRMAQRGNQETGEQRDGDQCSNE